MLVDIILVDELVIGGTMVTLGLLLELEVVEMTEVFETGMTVLELELVTTDEEFVTGSMVLENELEVTEVTEELVTLELLLKIEVVAEVVVLEDELEVEEVTDEEVAGRTTLELEELLELDLVEMTDEFEIGYGTLLELILLLEPEV